MGEDVSVVMDGQGPVAVLRMDWPDRHKALGPDEANEVGAASAARDSVYGSFQGLVRQLGALPVPQGARKSQRVLSTGKAR
jgi:hypothetical protein